MFSIGVTVRSRRSPSRSTVSDHRGVGAARGSPSCTCAQPTSVSRVTGSPSIATIVSPGRRPALSAGLALGQRAAGRPGVAELPRPAVIGTVAGVLRRRRSRRRRAARTPGTAEIVVVVSGTAEADQHDREEQDRQHQVVERAGEHDDDPLPPGLGVEDPALVGGQDVVERLAADLGDEAAHAGRALALALLGRRDHADDADVAAERDRLEAVLGLAAAPGEDRRPEADHELRHPHAEPAGPEEVAGLVEADREEQPDREGDDPQDREKDPAQLQPPAMTPRACSRAHFSAASTSSTQVGAPRSGASSRVRATRSTMPRNDSRPATNAATASSLAAL